MANPYENDGAGPWDNYGPWSRYSGGASESGQGVKQEAIPAEKAQREPAATDMSMPAPWEKYAAAAGQAAQAVGEVAAVMATDIPATVASGYVGIATGGDVEAMQATKEALSYKPSEVGQAALQRIGESIQEVTKYLPLEEIATTWTDSIVPAMQEKFGAKKGAALAASMLGLVNAAAEFNPATKVTKKAYHGSPHSFEEFKLSQIGTGEGAQAYGRGLYFAQSETVARGYRDILSNDIKLNGELFYSSKAGKTSNTTGDPYVDDLIIENNGDLDAAISHVEEFKQLGDSPIDNERLKLLEDLKNSNKLTVGQGNLYEVDLNISDDSLLDWDKPLNEQSELVQRAIEKTNVAKRFSQQDADAREAFGDSYSDNWRDTITGGSLYSGMQDAGDAAKASEELLSMGVKGIKYRDEFSRSGGNNVSYKGERIMINKETDPEKLAAAYKSLYKDRAEEMLRYDKRSPAIEWLDKIDQKDLSDAATSNFVVFDERLITMSRKYGIAIPAAAALLAEQLGVTEESLYTEGES